jgi:translation initiation factor IF-3
VLRADEGLSALFDFGPAGNPAAPNRFWRCLNISNKDMQINEQIRDREIRVITDAGEQLGIMSAREALRIAEEKDLDLVKIAPQATPPVCKIMDYGKYRFEQAKREKEARKNQHIVEIKEIRLSLNIDKHDFETKAGHARRFLKEGNKVKVSIRFRGREMAHPQNGLEIMKRFAQELQEESSVEKPAKLEGRSMIMFLAAKPVK